MDDQDSFYLPGENLSGHPGGQRLSTFNPDQLGDHPPGEQLTGQHPVPHSPLSPPGQNVSSHPRGGTLADSRYTATKLGNGNYATQVSPVRVPGRLAHGLTYGASERDRGGERNDGYEYLATPQFQLGITGFGCLTDREAEMVEVLADLVDPMDQVHAAVADALDEVRECFGWDCCGT